MKATLTVWGVRGSLPATDRKCMDYGGNTSCISLEYGDSLVCFDAGSGLSALIARMTEARRLDILITHFHIDHILGLFNLSAFRGEEIHLYGEGYGGAGFKERIETVAGRPYWPLGIDDLPAKVYLHELNPGDTASLPCGIEVSTLKGNHPGGSILYRADFCNKSVTYALDCEMGGDMFDRLTEFSKDTGMLIWDASFTEDDKQPGWGHSTWSEGIELAEAANAHRVMMTHYTRGYTDEFLREQERLAARKNNRCVFAREGMVITL